MEYDDFYENYSEFDMQIDEFKSSLMKSVKQEFLDRMAKLESQNLELEEIKEKWDCLVADYKHKEYLLEQEKNNAKSEAKKMRLEELIADKKIILYRPKTDYTEKPKCDKCNSERELEYKSPTGRTMFEKCECATKNAVYSPEPYCWYKFQIDQYDYKFKVFYKKLKSSYGNHEYFEGDSYGVKNIYNQNMHYRDVEYNTFFETKEECQKYCDWKNNIR